jgi:hypothetical protein
MRVWPQFLTCIITVASLAPAVRADEPNLAAAMRARLENFQHQAADPSKPCRTRDLNVAALISLMAGDDSKTAEDFLRRSYASQEMNSTARSFGQLRWIVTDANITDANAIEFASLPMGPLLLRFSNHLSPQFTDFLKPHLAASVASLRAHRVKTSYTNICLMNAVNLILMGQATSDQSAVTDGRHRLDDWITYTRKNGVAEFDSPTYYGVVLNSLAEGYRYATDAQDRAKFKTILDYFWTDIAANYFPPAQRMGGPYSRDYDFLAGTGDLDIWLADAGWSDAKALKSPSLDGVFLWDNSRAGGYEVPAKATELAYSGSREVLSTWGDSPSRIRWNWQGKSVAIGCTSGSYGEQDKMFAATFAGDREMPQIALVPDAHDAPYGVYKEKDRSGHSKPVHLPPSLGSVQSGGTVLLSMDLNPAKLPDSAAGMSTNFVLPSQATITINNQPANLSAGQQIDVPTDAVVTITTGGATVGIRLIAADSLNGHPPQLTLAADELGLSHHAVRLKLAHLAAGELSKSEHLRVAFLIVAADTDQPQQLITELAQAELTDHVDGDTWHLAAKLPSLSLEVDRSATDRNAISAQRINGRDAVPMVLSVDGKDLAGPIWAGQ